MKAENLRKSILQMAIQGKLVPQNPDDEPASVLLERIRAEKQRLIKEGKIKKDKSDSVIFKGDDNRHYEKIGNEIKDITDEIDFDLPEGWTVARLGSLLSCQTGASFKKDQASNDRTKIRILRGGNISDRGYKFYDNDIFIDYSLITENILLRKNDLITPAVTSLENVGKIAIIEKDYDNVSAGGFVFICRLFYSNDILGKFLLYALQSPYLNSQIKSITKKSGQAFYNIGKERLIRLLIPIPPLAEQERIVAEIEKYEPLIAEYDKLEQEKSKLDGEIYDKLKKSILQYAIQGKLVPQEPSDEPASILLEKIRAEKKAKLGKKYVDSFIYKGDDNCYYEKVGNNAPVLLENLPFDIPESWCWVRLGTIVDFSKSISISPNTIEESAWILDLEDIEKDSGKVLCKKRKGTLKVQSDKHKFKAGDVLYSKLRPYLNKVVIADEDGYCTSEILVFDFVPICNRYAQLYLMSPYFVDYAMAGAYGVKMPRLGSDRGNNAFMPIPPLHEQIRIANQVDKIFANIKDEA